MRKGEKDVRRRLTAGAERVAVDLVFGVLDRDLFGQEDDGAFGGAVCGCSHNVPGRSPRNTG